MHNLHLILNINVNTFILEPYIVNLWSLNNPSLCQRVALCQMSHHLCNRKIWRCSKSSFPYDSVGILNMTQAREYEIIQNFLCSEWPFFETIMIAHGNNNKYYFTEWSSQYLSIHHLYLFGEQDFLLIDWSEGETVLLSKLDINITAIY